MTENYHRTKTFLIYCQPLKKYLLTNIQTNQLEVSEMLYEELISVHIPVFMCKLHSLLLMVLVLLFYRQTLMTLLVPESGQ